MNAQMVFILVKKTQLLVCILAAPIVSGALTAVHGQSAEQLDKEAIGTYDRGNISQAILLYQRLVKLQPDSVPLRTTLGKGKDLTQEAVCVERFRRVTSGRSEARTFVQVELHR